MQKAKKVSLRIGDLRKYLEQSEISPEKFAKEVNISHMTIRRWLKKKDQEPIPAKYLLLLGPRLGKIPAPELPKLSLTRALKDLSMDELLREIEANGKKFKKQNLRPLESAVKNKLKLTSGDESFAKCCEQLLDLAKSAKEKSRARDIAIGALLYFVEPLGVPGESPFIDYLGELALLSIALNLSYGLHVFDSEGHSAQELG